MERPVLYETVSSGLAAESRDNVRFEVTDVSIEYADYGSDGTGD